MNKKTTDVYLQHNSYLSRYIAHSDDEESDSDSYVMIEVDWSDQHGFVVRHREHIQISRRELSGLQVVGDIDDKPLDIILRDASEKERSSAALKSWKQLPFPTFSQLQRIKLND